ncbi:hypothetical protein [Streptomyces silvisoli]|uniref:Uncharacterized protein n=1 Tax=Streptomyces silvisoli TaxID=3034235 RepID=A0ABT5ZWA9_9ACTN|nr:hypothetical protein [Streptomyces silvisoli]MDF3293931.1 hypothetical protein [Streptomyces silvisoli]
MREVGVASYSVRDSDAVGFDRRDRGQLPYDSQEVGFDMMCTKHQRVDDEVGREIPEHLKVDLSPGTAENCHPVQIDSSEDRGIGAATLGL